MSIKEKLVSGALKQFDSIEDLEVEVMASGHGVAELYGKYRELEIKYNKLKSAVVGLGRKLGVELIIDEEDEQMRILSGIVDWKNGRAWVTPEELNK